MGTPTVFNQFKLKQHNGNAATSPLIMYMTEGADFGNTTGDLILDASATTGVLNLT